MADDCRLDRHVASLLAMTGPGRCAMASDSAVIPTNNPVIASAAKQSPTTKPIPTVRHVAPLLAMTSPGRFAMTSGSAVIPTNNPVIASAAKQSPNRRF